MNKRQRPPRRLRSRLLKSALLIGVTVFILVGLGAVALGIAIINQARKDEARPADAIVVLGTAHWAGHPSPTFRARLDHAYDLYQEGYAPLVVLTGGAAEGDVLSEAEVGGTYLAARGIPREAMLVVAGGEDSYESLKLASERLDEQTVQDILLVSDPFHMFRLKQIAQDLGFDAFTSPTETSPIHPGSPAEQRYVVREMLAYVNYLYIDS